MTNDTSEYLSLQEKIVWFAVSVTECIVVFIINAFTLIAFARNRNLRKRSTFLIINLTVADLLLGAVTLPLEMFGPDIEPENGFRWGTFFMLTLFEIFPVASLANISFISLERLHATLYPFRHCLVGEWVYFKIIICIWLIALLLASVMTRFVLYAPFAYLYVIASYIFLTLLILTVSYTTIISNVKRNPHSQNFGSVLSYDRKLSVTLFIVIVVSFLTIVPWGIYTAILLHIWYKLSFALTVRITITLRVLYFANSIANPLIYAIRMQEFRKSVKELVCKRTPESMRVQPIELSTM